MKMNKQDTSQLIVPAEVNQPALAPEKKQPQIMIALLAIFVAILAFQAVQLRALNQTIKSGAVIQGQANQGAASLFEGLRSQVGGCGG